MKALLADEFSLRLVEAQVDLLGVEVPDRGAGALVEALVAA